MTPPLHKQYQWLIDRLSDALGKDRIRWAELDHGHQFAIAYIGNGRRYGLLVEHDTYSLNADQNKDVFVEALIEQWKLL